MEEALPYLLELAEYRLESASCSWAKHYLGTYYLQRYYAEQQRRRVSREKVASVTEEAAINAALEQFQSLSETYPDSPFAEEDAYRVASMKAALRKGGVERDGALRGIQAYEAFLQSFPEGQKAGQAKMSIAAIKFEQAKSGRIPYQEAYTAMEDIMAVSDTLSLFIKGRVLLMMAEIQHYQFKNHGTSLQLLEQISLAPGQNVVTASSAMYLKAEAYRGLGDYTSAVATFVDLLENYENTDSSLDFDLHPISLYSMGECLMKLEDWEGAYRAFEQLKDDWPDDVRSRACRFMFEECDEKRGEGQ